MRPLHVVIFVFGFFHFCHGRRLVSPQTRPSRSGKATTITSSLNQNVTLVSEDERKRLLPLSAVSDFTSELAQTILGKDYSQHRIDSWASEGSLLSKSSSDEPRYKIHSLVREALYAELSKTDDKLRDVHHVISEYFELNVNPTLAMEHAFLSQDFVRFEKLFRAGARTYAATGRGKELLRWAKYAGDDSVVGQLQRQAMHAP